MPNKQNFGVTRNIHDEKSKIYYILIADFKIY